MSNARAASDNVAGNDGSQGSTAANARAILPRRKARRVGKSDMSPRDDHYYGMLYKTEPNFKQLALQDSDFAGILKATGQLDFSDPASVKQLTKTLLKTDFGLEIELPDDRLCPPVPVRHNYVLWLKVLLDSTSYAQPLAKLTGIDIGTGASCIYPLLACVQRPWYMIATDIDTKSLNYARQNVQANDLEDRIKLTLRKETDTIIPLDDLGIDRADFIMTNPPFYATEEEMLASAESKSRPPNSACTGAPVEMICEGGEDAFVDRIFQESLILRERIRWYTSMFGKAESLGKMVEKLRDANIDNFAVTEFVQGSKTRRWAVGWSFGSLRPSADAARGLNPNLWRKLLPASTEADIMRLPVGKGLGSHVDDLVRAIDALDLISWCWDKERSEGIGRAAGNVWGRAWRRRSLHKPHDENVAMEVVKVSEAKCMLGFKVTFRVRRDEATISCRWCEGHDQVLYQSFCGYLKAQVKQK